MLTLRLLCGAGRGTRRDEGGGVGASGPASSDRCLRLSAAGSAAVPAAAAINLRGRGGRGQGQARAATPCPARESPASQLGGEMGKVSVRALAGCSCLVPPSAPRVQDRETQALGPKRDTETGSLRARSGACAPHSCRNRAANLVVPSGRGCPQTVTTRREEALEDTLGESSQSLGGGLGWPKGTVRLGCLLIAMAIV